jgi:Fe(3+) dicitrate transport protein
MHRGLEGGLGLEVGAGWSLAANATYIPTARYNSTKIVGGIDRNGNRLPYAPEVTTNLALNYKTGGFKSSLSVNYVSSQLVDAENTKAESVDGRIGEIPAYTTLNLNAHYAISKKVSVFGTIRNLFDKQYIVSRNPDGIFPGVERNFEIGMNYKF